MADNFAVTIITLVNKKKSSKYILLSTLENILWAHMTVIVVTCPSQIENLNYGAVFDPNLLVCFSKLKTTPLAVQQVPIV